MHASPLQFKDAAAKFVSGVTVVLTGRLGKIHGITVSAFSSVSLTPPLVLVCVNTASSLIELVSETGAFTVNILSAQQSHLSEFFSKPGRDPLASLDPLGIDYELGITGVPVLKEAASHFDCKLTEMHPRGDHTILLGSVLDARAGPNPPLVFFSRSYRNLEPA